MIAPKSRMAFSTSQSSLFGPSASLRSSASTSTLFATSASTLFGAVNVGLTQNQVRHSIPFMNGPESKLKLCPLYASSASLRSLISSGDKPHLNELVDKINRSFVIVPVCFLFFLLWKKLITFV